MMYAALRRLARPDGGFERGGSQSGVDRATDRVAYHLARPSVQNRRQVDEARHDRDVCDVGNPKLVRTVDDEAAGAIGEDEAVVIAVGRNHIAPSALGLEIMFAHQSPKLLMIDDDTLMAKRGANTAIAV